MGLLAQKHPGDAHIGCTGSLPVPPLPSGMQVIVVRGAGGGNPLGASANRPLP